MCIESLIAARLHQLVIQLIEETERLQQGDMLWFSAVDVESRCRKGEKQTHDSHYHACSQTKSKKGTSSS